MNKLIFKILKEATYGKDTQIDKFVSNIINNVKSNFKNFNGENKYEFEYNAEGQTVVFEDTITGGISGILLTIIFYDRTSKYADYTSGGVHIFPKNTIKIYGCNLDWEEDENGGHWFDLNINESVLYHELVHFYDFNKRKSMRLNKQPYKTNRSTEKEQSKYYNHGLEFNAYFLQYVMPLINTFKELHNNKQLPDNYSFQKFFKGILNNEKVNNYYEKLNKEMKKHFIKRVSEYYQKIMNEID